MMRFWRFLTKKDSTLQTVPYVDLRRYAGVWYEIARFPNRFQKGCVGSKAVYTLRDDGTFDVLNQCRDGYVDGRIRAAKGTAWVTDHKTNARLKVSFFKPFAGDYWIIDLAEDYSYAVVGHPDRKYLWILSRKKSMDDDLYRGILARLERKGYETARLVHTKHSSEGEET